MFDLQNKDENKGAKMIANGHPYGDKGYVILEEGEINPETYAFNVHHYLVVYPDGTQESGTFTMDEAKEKIDHLMDKS